MKHSPLPPLDMPPLQPLAMPVARFDVAPTEKLSRPKTAASVIVFRVLAFLPVLVTTAALLTVVAGLFSSGGIGWIEGLLMALMGTSFVWISLSVSTATLGLVVPPRPNAASRTPPAPVDVAILMTIYNEPPDAVLGNVLAMMHDLDRRACPHRFSVFVLSDTQAEEARKAERRAISEAQALAPSSVPLFYRNRETNTDRKTGNIADWVQGWGGGYEAMLVLDADSLMTAEAITKLADEIGADPSLGLVQSQPKLYNARSLFARLQQFGTHVYGPNLARGLALWAGNTANFWGHNAMIRTRAFAASAGLPKLTSLRRQPRLILSHDFVEAALLRRNGWAVRFLPEIEGSFEEAPESLYDFVQRDRRWCHGNLQHLRLLTIKGLPWLSRVHFVSGAFSYLLSPAWFLLLTIWVMLGRDSEANPISYFSTVNPLYPHWPEPQLINSFWILLFIYGMLLLPKALGVAQILVSRDKRQAYGGTGSFLASFIAELALSIIYAPVLMVQQTLAVLRAVTGAKQDWRPRTNADGALRWRALLRLHAIETALGLMITLGMVLGLVSPWLSPIALSFVLAVPLSALSTKRWFAARMSSPIDVAQHPLTRHAQHWRSELSALSSAEVAPSRLIGP